MMAPKGNRDEEQREEITLLKDIIRSLIVLIKLEQQGNQNK